MVAQRERDYELVMVLTPEATEEEAEAAVERVTSFVSEHGGNVLIQDSWGVRRLAYPIQRFQEGNYFLTRFALDAKDIRELEALLHASQDILRHLVTKVDKDAPEPPTHEEEAAPEPTAAEEVAAPEPPTAEKEAAPEPPTAEKEAAPEPPTAEKEAAPEPPTAEKEAAPEPPTAEKEAAPEPPTAEKEAPPAAPADEDKAVADPPADEDNKTEP